METTNTPTDGFVAGKTPDADCGKVMQILDKMIDGYASYEEESFFGDHAQDCSPCFEDLEKQQHFIRFLNNSIAQKGAPSSLIDSIKSRIQKTV